MSPLSNSARIALVGRPNVGKSTLFNKLTRSRKALVKNEPGVTRDILLHPAEWWGFSFEVMDTGGLTESKEGLNPLIREGVLSVLNSVDGLVVVMDARSGLVPEDRDIIRIAKETGKPFVIAVNKIDNSLEADMAISEFFEFGMDILPCAFERDFGIDEIVEWIKKHTDSGEKILREGIRLSLVGKPNAGKSSLANQLIGSSRMLVSEVAGTTADSVEESFVRDDQTYVLVDTAGLRKSARRSEGVERISAHKSKEAIRKSEIVLLLIDGLIGPSGQDARIVEYCLEQHKAILVVVNKIDEAEKKIERFREAFREQMARSFHFFPDIPMVFVSAKTGRGIDSLFEKINEMYQKLTVKIPTSKLNKFFMDVIRAAPAPVYGTKDVKFYYLTQTEQMPPSFIAFANEPNGVTPAYRRFVSKRLAEAFDLQGIPLRIFVMKKRKGKRKPVGRSDPHAVDELMSPAFPMVYDLNDRMDEGEEE